MPCNDYMKYEDLECLTPQDLHFSIEKEKKMSPFDQPKDAQLKVVLLWVLVGIVVGVATGLWWFTNPKANNGPIIFRDDGIVKQVVLWTENGNIIYETKWAKVDGCNVTLDNGTVLSGTFTVNELEEIPTFILEKPNRFPTKSMESE